MKTSKFFEGQEYSFAVLSNTELNMVRGGINDSDPTKLMQEEDDDIWM